MRRISLEPAAMVRSGGLFEGDLVAEGVELFDGSVALAVGVRSSLEVVAAEVVVVGVFGEEMPADDEDGVADGDRGLFLADPSSETPELRCKVGVAGAGGRPGALHEDVAEPYVAVGGLAGTAFPPVMLLPGAIPAQEAKWAAVGNRDMSTPISAMIVSAARFPTPVMVSSRSRARSKGTPASLVFAASNVSIWSSRRAVAASRWAVWSRQSPMSRA